ncbi:MAG: Integral rane protein CcmA involved in cell shape determination [Acidobacteria bacterium]|nr:Integral rane protein CcmA involved in cell shape determination [Acidobacteriota bacterium]
MENDPNDQVARDAAAHHSETEVAPRDTKADFEAWLERLKPRQPIGDPRKQSPQLENHKPDFFVVCTDGSDCRISFDGVLHIEGFLSGSIHSDGGTLVTGCGLIDGNIQVGAAFIDSSIIGNIRATERVVLYAEAKVAGNIISPALSTKPGALFEGDCVLHETILPRHVPLNSEVAGEFVDQFQV